MSRVVLLVLLVGCSPAASHLDSVSCSLAAASGAPAVELFHTNAAGDEVITQPMDQIMLVQPPQGGWVFYVIPHVTNMDCQLQLKTTLIDTCTGKGVVSESRPIEVQEDGMGWGVPINIASDGIVAACPQSSLARNLYDEPYLIDVVAEDRHGHRAETSVRVNPTCSDAYCRCQCDRTYKDGDNCPVIDAGAPAATIECAYTDQQTSP